MTTKAQTEPLPVLPMDKMFWPCPTCGKRLNEHARDEQGRLELGSCYIIAILKHVLGEGIGWHVLGTVDAPEEDFVIGEMR